MIYDKLINGVILGGPAEKSMLYEPRNYEQNIVWTVIMYQYLLNNSSTQPHFRWMIVMGEMVSGILEFSLLLLTLSFLNLAISQ